MIQDNLFPDNTPRIKGLDAGSYVRNARTADPQTSKDAGRNIERSGKAGAQRRLVADTLRLHPGSTFAELAADFAGPDADPHLVSELKQVFHRRLPELRERNEARNGDKRTCRIDGTSKQTWYPA